MLYAMEGSRQVGAIEAVDLAIGVGVAQHASGAVAAVIGSALLAIGAASLIYVTGLTRAARAPVA
jgi:hypothetical protein